MWVAKVLVSRGGSRISGKGVYLYTGVGFALLVYPIFLKGCGQLPIQDEWLIAAMKTFSSL